MGGRYVAMAKAIIEANKDKYKEAFSGSGFAPMLKEDILAYAEELDFDEHMNGLKS